MKIIVSSNYMLKFLQGISVIDEYDDNYFEVTVLDKVLSIHKDGVEQGKMDVEAKENIYIEISGATFTKLIRLLKALNDCPIVIVLGSSYLQIDNIML